MKKIILILFILCTTFFIYSVDTASANLYIRGIVEESVSISVEVTSEAQNLMLSVEPTMPKIIATMALFSNSNFELVISSDNDFQLVGLNGVVIDYSVMFNSTEVTSDGVIMNMSSVSDNSLTIGILWVLPSGFELEEPSEYTDTLTFTISSL